WTRFAGRHESATPVTATRTGWRESRSRDAGSTSTTKTGEPGRVVATGSSTGASTGPSKRNVIGPVGLKPRTSLSASATMRSTKLFRSGFGKPVRSGPPFGRRRASDGNGRSWNAAAGLTSRTSEGPVARFAGAVGTGPDGVATDAPLVTGTGE